MHTNKFPDPEMVKLFRMIADLHDAMVLARNYNENQTIQDFIKRSEDFKRVDEYLLASQMARGEA